jgi:hypothetical protein
VAPAARRIFFDFPFSEQKSIIYRVKERKIKTLINAYAYWFSSSLSITTSSGIGHDQLGIGGTYASAADGGGGGVAQAGGGDGAAQADGGSGATHSGGGG